MYEDVKSVLVHICWCALLLMTLKAEKLTLETKPFARDNNTILTLKPGDQTLPRLTRVIIIVKM